jgi:hypothetical protein
VAANTYTSCCLDIRLSHREAAPATVAGRMRKREARRSRRHQAKPAVPCEIRASAARLAPASLRKGSRELQVSHHLPNDFTKSGESASALARN